LRTRFRFRNNAASSKLDDDNRSPLRLRYACFTRQGQAYASRSAFSPKNSQGSAPKWTLPSAVYLPDGDMPRIADLPVSPFVVASWNSTTCFPRMRLPLPCSCLTGHDDRFYSGHTPPLRRFAVDYCYFHPADHCRAPATTPAATAVPVLALVFLSLLTSLADVIRRTLSSYVPGSRPGIVSRDRYDHAFQPAEHRSSGLPADERRSLFGTVFNESHLQGLSPRSWLSYSPKSISRTPPRSITIAVPHVAVSEVPHASRG